MADQEVPQTPHFRLTHPESGEEVVFESPSEAHEWLKDETEGLDWVNEVNAIRNKDDFNAHLRKARDNVEACLRLHRKAAEKGRLSGQDRRSLEEAIESAQAAFEKVHTANPQVLASTAAGRFLISIKDQIGQDSAAIAAFHLGGEPPTFRSNNDSSAPWTLEGVLHAALFRTGLDPRAASSAKAAWDGLRGEAQAAVHQLSQRLRTIKEEREKLLERVRAILKRVRSSRRRQRTRIAERAEQLFSGIDERYEKLDEHYRERVAMHEAVEYWRLKEQEHAGEASRWMTHTFRAAGVGAVLLLVVWGGVAWMIFGREGIAPEVTAWMFGIVTVIAVLVVYLVKMFGRIATSHHHLTADAGQRRVATQTYLALLQEGHAGAEHRAIILTSLFRPAATGLVSDSSEPRIDISTGPPPESKK